MTPDLITRYAAPVPRYTSYPTAPHFHEGINAGVYHHWLEALPDDATLSALRACAVLRYAVLVLRL